MIQVWVKIKAITLGIIQTVEKNTSPGFNSRKSAVNYHSIC